jgi:cell division protein FtsW
MARAIRSLVARLDDYDGWLLSAVFMLCLLGTLMVFGAASYRAEALSGTWGHFYYLIKHVIRLALGLLAMIVLANLDYRVLLRRTLCWSLLGVGLLLTLLPVLLKAGGAPTRQLDINRWFTVFGLFPVQPLEFAKIALVLFLAERIVYLQRHGWRSRREASLIWVAPVLLVLILIGQPNYGNALIICLMTWALLFLAGFSLRWLLAIIAGVGAVGLAGVLLIGKISTRVGHWWAGLHGEGDCYQVYQSLIGLGAGGWHGLGLGASHQRFWFLPESHTDFIFAVIGEELGLLGTLGTLAVFVIMIYRGLAIAQRAGDAFGRLTASGLTLLLFLYAAFNTAMVIGLCPVIGVPLPFISYGGSALVTNLGIVGILLSIDRHGRAYQQWRSRVEARLSRPV